MRVDYRQFLGGPLTSYMFSILPDVALSIVWVGWTDVYWNIDKYRMAGGFSYKEIQCLVWELHLGAWTVYVHHNWLKIVLYNLSLGKIHVKWTKDQLTPFIFQTVGPTEFLLDKFHITNSIQEGNSKIMYYVTRMDMQHSQGMSNDS